MQKRLNEKVPKQMPSYEYSYMSNNAFKNQFQRYSINLQSITPEYKSSLPKISLRKHQEQKQNNIINRISHISKHIQDKFKQEKRMLSFHDQLLQQNKERIQRNIQQQNFLKYRQLRRMQLNEKIFEKLARKTIKNSRMSIEQKKQNANSYEQQLGKLAQSRNKNFNYDVINIRGHERKQDQLRQRFRNILKS